MPAWIQSKEIVNEKVGEPCHGMPVARMHCRKSPKDSSEGQPLLDMRVVCDIKVVIEVNEFVIPHLPKSHKSYQDEKKANQEF
jgi:hypothetical protein